ncbi:hypothetical protein TNCV_4767861, partial [Trichonephila clavipes]
FTNTVVNKKDTKVCEVNTRLAYAMRSVAGKEAKLREVFCGLWCHLHQAVLRVFAAALNNATEKVARVVHGISCCRNAMHLIMCNPNVHQRGYRWYVAKRGAILLSVVVVTAVSV